jgi:hypothetical protein
VKAFAAFLELYRAQFALLSGQFFRKKMFAYFLDIWLPQASHHNSIALKTSSRILSLFQESGRACGRHLLVDHFKN